MSDIKVGDLVMVVKPIPCCGAVDALSWTFVVEKIRNSRSARCVHCNARLAGLVADGHDRCSFKLNRLKRIPPLSELEGKKETADLGEAMRKLKRELLEMGK